MIKAIFFDNGGVLCQEGYNAGIEKYEREFNIPAGEFYKIVHDHQGWKDFTLGLISEAEYLVLCQQRSGAYTFNANRFIELMDEFAEPNGDLIDYISSLSEEYIIGVISNHPKEWFERYMKRVGLDETIKVKAISCYLRVRKPAKEIFEYALQQAGVKPAEAVYVDDREDIITGARELGFKTIVFDNLENFKQKLKPLIS